MRKPKPAAARLVVSPANRRLTLIGITLVAVIFAVTAWLVVGQRTADLAQNEQVTANLAQVLAEQTSRTMQPVDLTLREFQGRMTPSGSEHSDIVDDPGSKATFDLLVERLKGLPQVDALAVVGADGRLINISRGYPPRPLDLSDRDYYLHLSTHDDHALFVSAPVRAYFDGRWTVYLARRLNGAHGEFAGIVLAAVTLSFLEDFYRAVTPENVSVAVLRRDGVILVRHPHGDARIGDKLPADVPVVRTSGRGGRVVSIP